MNGERVYLFDSTLRDGAQTQGVDFSVADKVAIAADLDALGIDYIEGGWPGANPTDDNFFHAPPQLKKAKPSSPQCCLESGPGSSQPPSITGSMNLTVDKFHHILPTYSSVSPSSPSSVFISV